MEVELRDIATITPYEKNPRLNDGAVDAVLKSIKEFGWRVPIVCDKDMVVICGHTRLKAAQQLDLTRVPVHVATELSPEQCKAYRLADNQTASIAEWDMELLPSELGDLKDLDFDLSLLGWTPEELDQIMSANVTPGADDPDEVPEVPAAPVSQVGDFWVMGEHKLLCGNSTDPKDVQRLLAGERAAMAFTDPPWNVAIGKDSNPRHRQREGLQNDDLSERDFTAFINGFAARLQESVEGDVYCVLGASEWPALDRGLRGAGFHWSATVIWVKQCFVLGRAKYHRRYEPIWYGWHGKGKSSYAGGRSEDDVWEVPRPFRSEEHPTMKPVALVERAIKNSSQHGDLVWEPFMGSGTTLIACERLGRRCRGMEIEPRYVDVTVRRWELLTGRKAERFNAKGEPVGGLSAAHEKAPTEVGA